MDRITELSSRILVLLLTADWPRQRERGDVPGWVLITVMTAGLVAAIWATAGDQLQSMLTSALRSVGGND